VGWVGSRRKETVGAYIANHAVFQRLVCRLIEFRPACYADQIVLIGWGSSGGGVDLVGHCFDFEVTSGLSVVALRCLKYHSRSGD